MLDYQLLPSDGILEVHPSTPLQARDFAQLAEVVDRYLSNHDSLNGLLISTDDFPGWEDFSALVSHVEFIHDHHKKIRKVAAVSNDTLLTVLPPIANHFVGAEVKHFDKSQLDDARSWISH